MLRYLAGQTRWSAQFGFRQLTTNETSVALRPFYFAIHPDFFGQYPKERATNEDSLKKVGQYLEALHSQRRTSPLDVTVYMREPRDTQAVKPVKISLLNHTDVRSAVSRILQCCNLSLEYLTSIPNKTALQSTYTPNRPIKWDPTYYRYTGTHNPYAERTQTKPKRTFRGWLIDSIKKAEENDQNTKHVREENEKLTVQICDQLQLKSLQWKSEWGYRNYRSCLNTFARLVQENQTKLSHLKGKSVYFCDKTGVSILGNVLLSAGDVSTDWLSMLTNVSRHEETLLGLPDLEMTLSDLLHDIQIVRRPDHGIVMAKEYDKQLRALISSVNRCWKAKRDVLGGSLNHLQLVVETSSGPLAISTSGQFLVPSSCPGSILIDFIVNNRHKANTLLKEHERKSIKTEAILHKCQSELDICSLERDASLPPDKILTFCENLMKEAYNVKDLLKGARVLITFHSSISDDGKLLVPWNWVDIYD